MEKSKTIKFIYRVAQTACDGRSDANESRAMESKAREHQRCHSPFGQIMQIAAILYN